MPAAPGWDVHDVLAHLAANPTDGLAGRITGLPTDEFTGEQVGAAQGGDHRGARRGVAGQHRDDARAARAGLAPPNLAVDAVTHEQDIRGALGVARVADEARSGSASSCSRSGTAVSIEGGRRPTLRSRRPTATSPSSPTTARPAATLRASEFELFRTFSGRRGRAPCSRSTGTATPRHICLRSTSSARCPTMRSGSDQ